MSNVREMKLWRLRWPYRSFRVWSKDRALNRAHVRGDARFLVVRHPCESPNFYDLLLDWLEKEHPEVRARFELHGLPCRPHDAARYAVHVPWLQDPVQAWSPLAYRMAERLTAWCDAHEIPVVNRVDRLTNASKSMGSTCIGRTGLRTPRMARIVDVAAFREDRAGIPLPLFVREDWGHGGPMLRAETPEQVRDLPIESLRRPVAVEWIDVKSPDGLWRKYRYVVAGDLGVRQTMHVTDHWQTRGTDNVFSEALAAEEIAFISSPEPLHSQFLAAKEAMGLDVVAFDYSYDSMGRPVVWEANPFPYLHWITGRRAYRVETTRRVLAAMTRCYLKKAGLEVPAPIEVEARLTST